MVEEQELHHPFLRRIGHGRGALRAHLHAIGDGNGTRGLGLGLSLDLDETGTARRHGVEQRVVAEARDLDAHQLGDTDHEHALGHAHLDAVDADRHQVGGGDLGGTLRGDGHRAATSPKT